MSQWYFTKNKKAHGPVNDEQVRALFEQGDLHVSDLLFKDGDHRWKTLSEWPEFKALASDSAFATGERHWVVLKASRNENGPVYKQHGPFSVAEVTFMLQKGEVSFGEYAWRPGFDQWIRLGQIPEFDRRREVRPEAIPVSERPIELAVAKQISLDDVYEHVVTSESLKQDEQEKTVIQTDILPEAAPVTGEPFKAESATDESTQVIDVASVEESESTQVGKVLPPKRKANWGLRALFAGTLTAAVLLVMSQGLEYLKRRPVSQTPQPAPQRLVAEAAQPQLQVEPPKPVEPVLTIEPVDLENRAQLHFPTTVQADAVQVWIQGKSGQIVELPSFQVALKISRQGGTLAQLDLASLGMPQGAYDVQARAGQLTAYKSIFVGKQDEAFQKRLEAHRKQISFKQQQERADLLSLVRSFEGSLKSLQTEFLKTANAPKKWAAFYPRWQKGFRELQNESLSRITVQTRNQYAFPDLWLDVQAMRKSILSQADGLQNAVQAGRTPASQINAELAPRLNQMKSKVLRLSGR